MRSTCARNPLHNNSKTDGQQENNKLKLKILTPIHKKKHTLLDLNNKKQDNKYFIINNLIKINNKNHILVHLFKQINFHNKSIEQFFKRAGLPQ